MSNVLLSEATSDQLVDAIYSTFDNFVFCGTINDCGDKNNWLRLEEKGNVGEITGLSKKISILVEKKNREWINAFLKNCGKDGGDDSGF
jgi:hypothetical protein